MKIIAFATLTEIFTGEFDVSSTEDFSSKITEEDIRCFNSHHRFIMSVMQLYLF